MLAIAMASLLVAASDSAPLPAGSLKREPVRYCRALVVGASRSGDVKICRTKGEWLRYDSCHGATRYCEPRRTASLGSNTPFPLNEDARIVCRVLRATGSRLSSQRTCLPQREWQRLWDESRSTMGSLQDKYSKKAPGETR
jgi:hypothetical protein